jgi:hypothetical protein
MRYAVITAATAAVVIGAGTAFGSSQQSNPGATPKPSPLSAPQVSETLRQKCEQDRQETRKEHPDAVISECNYGEGTLTTP